MHTTFLQQLWFILIGVLWVAFFVLEGFDFGVGMLVATLGRDDGEKRMMIHTIGPVWDGNEVWLIVAGGATFAAFPGWYATAFSGFYLPLFLVLAALIVRGVSFEFWGKVPSPRWRRGWEWALAITSGAAALLFGVAWADFAHGVPMNAAHQMTASVWDLLHPYALVGGVTMLSLFVTHGANFLALRTTGEVHRRARRTAAVLAPLGAAAAVALLAWTVVAQSGASVVLVAAILAVIATLAMLASAGRADGRAFAASTAVIVLVMVTLLAALYPNALPSSTNHAFDLTLAAAASNHYTLVVMTVVAIIFVPVVLAYTSWTYFVFRQRLGSEQFSGTLTPLAVLEQKFPRLTDGGRGAGPSAAGAGEDGPSGRA
jgi:cytochrome d ubiquinol oxidase subunit II